MQQYPLLQTKLYIPPIRPELVSRPRLIERLNEGLDRKLTLISAPAGFGKTTLVSEWVIAVGVRTKPDAPRNRLALAGRRRQRPDTLPGLPRSLPCRRIEADRSGRKGVLERTPIPSAAADRGHPDRPDQRDCRHPRQDSSSSSTTTT